MTTSTWHHAAVAVSALAGEREEVLRAALAEEAHTGIAARWRYVHEAVDRDARARRIVAERLRATRATDRERVVAPRAGRVLALWLLGSAHAERVALARALPPELLAAARAEVSWARSRAARAPMVARWGALALRALRRVPVAREWDELVAELAGEGAARVEGARRIERALRVAGLRAASEDTARAIAGGA